MTGNDKRYESLIREAQRNEEILKRFQTFELSIMDTESPKILIDLLLKQNNIFFDCDRITLTLIDPQDKIKNLLLQSGLDPDKYSELNFIRDGQLFNRLFRNSQKPLLGNFQPELHESFFNEPVAPLASVGILPLSRNQQYIGSFNLASCDGNRFNKNDATDFLQHFSSVITVCIENTLARERLKNLGLIDNLTGINNRRYFDRKLNEEVIRHKRSGNPISCLFIDLDYFKQINDNYGHQTGDDVLRHAAHIIKEQIRNIDVVARYGGEEFTVILLQSNSDRAREIAERIRKKIEQQPFPVNAGQPIQITVSIGTNTLKPDHCNEPCDKTINSFIEAADKALYKAKNSGRNKTVSA